MEIEPKEYRITEEVFYSYMDHCKLLYPSPDDYVPEEYELTHVIEPTINDENNPKGFAWLLVLAWIDECGVETKENKKVRSLIKRVINRHLTLVSNRKKNSGRREKETKQS